MNKNKALIDSKDTSISITYGTQSVTIFEDDLKRLIDEHTTKEHFIEMAEAMTNDFVKMEGYDWQYDSKELQRKLAVIYNNII